MCSGRGGILFLADSLGLGGGCFGCEGMAGGGIEVAFAPDGVDAGAPAFVEGDQGPGNGGREVAEDGLGGGVDVEGGRDEQEPRRPGAEAGFGEVAVLLEVAEAGGGVGPPAGFGRGGCEVVVADADPVVEALEGVVEAFDGFELDDGELPFAGDGEEVERAAVEARGASAGEGRAPAV